ncbi:MAG: RNA polymerase-associated protein RapA [SAR86 cluster bacterium]|uniref:RNA polymerase-associated protein RapA n=1 Tax=SAR86 cluster bacterium TaxID=2030880 RepID=A0A2A5CA57_9GAMM|nr:RNA polymerase-associated protein RapA [Gammaproteobacteria bacterium AH-315-E17]PCJ40371.1 MAG: RNA polymerase-associated protein RapA [SAR86 cluster bacterium]
MTPYALGQRWISDSEPELGLGLITEVDLRIISVEFPQTAETRLYAKDRAPLSRILFNVGDTVHDREQNAYQVQALNEIDGLTIYQVTDQNNQVKDLPESSLTNNISLDQPLKRLLAGQFDHKQWFELRSSTLDTLNFIESSPLLGLCSARTELLAHQLYIANEVAQRYAPRVLLADEVGLGKTIEACLIMQQQLFSGLASRILIIVPETLLHQWLVELLRRFNLAFSIVDVDRCEASASNENPFLAEQLILCSNDFFINNPERHQQALDAEWDLLIVDEAHHLKATENNPSSQEISPEALAYNHIKAFSQAVKGLILLTATPDQLGAESYFALLRLLDADRFHDFESFSHEQNNFTKIATLIEKLEQDALLSNTNKLKKLIDDLSLLFNDKHIQALGEKLLSAKIDDEEKNQLRQSLIDAVLDRHGTGRILFRNSRKVISGFPARKLHEYPLEAPPIYQGMSSKLTPETESKESEWLKLDPRVEWLEGLLKKHPAEKILLICAHKNTAKHLEKFLRLRRGVRTAVFHEDMSLIERDRAAAYFAEKENGARLLLCSEIGSEGRNFQFSHHLVLFDLPLNPDLLEQRIGRLDRIGQTQTINIHAPYFSNTAQAVLFHCYHAGLNAFQQTNPASYKVFDALKPLLEEALGNPADYNSKKISGLVSKVQAENKRLHEGLLKGRDRLLELNSFKPEVSQGLINDITELEKTASPEAWLESVFDNYGLNTERNSDGSWIVKPDDEALVDGFPGVPESGLSFTCQRSLALSREDLQFVSWHHPLLNQSIDFILQGDLGKASLAVLQNKRLPQGYYFLESIYRINLPAAREFQLQRFLPTTTIRTLLSSEGNDLAPKIAMQDLNAKLQLADKYQFTAFIAENKEQLTQLSQLSEKTASEQLPAIIKNSAEKMLTELNAEINRLLALQTVNPNIRDTEIGFLKNQRLFADTLLDQASLQLEGLRLIFVSE